MATKRRILALTWLVTVDVPDGKCSKLQMAVSTKFHKSSKGEGALRSLDQAHCKSGFGAEDRKFEAGQPVSIRCAGGRAVTSEGGFCVWRGIGRANFCHVQYYFCLPLPVHHV